MKRNYYYIISSLPELQPTDNELPFSIASLKEELLPHLAPADQALLKTLFYPTDNQNLIRTILHQEDAWEEGGNFSPEELSFGLDVPDTLPAYMREFIDTYGTRWSDMTEEELNKSLLPFYVNWLLTVDNDFLKEWYLFDSSLRNILAGLNCQKHDMAFAGEVMGDHFIAEQIREVRTADFGLEKVLPYINDVLGFFEGANLLERELDLEKLKWQKLEQMSQMYYFSIEGILLYFLKMKIIERNIITDEGRGSARLEEIVANMMKDKEIPEEFSLKR